MTTNNSRTTIAPAYTITSSADANGAPGKKDFIRRIRISRREAKESRLFLRLRYTDESDAPEREQSSLVQEATELIRLFNAILRKTE